MSYGFEVLQFSNGTPDYFVETPPQKFSVHLLQDKI
jgi:hypothetical protein